MFATDVTKDLAEGIIDDTCLVDKYSLKKHLLTHYLHYYFVPRYGIYNVIHSFRLFPKPLTGEYSFISKLQKVKPQMTHQAQRAQLVISFVDGVHLWVHAQISQKSKQTMTDYSVGPGGSLNSLDLFQFFCWANFRGYWLTCGQNLLRVFHLFCMQSGGLILKREL